MAFSESLEELPPPPASFLEDTEIEQEIFTALSRKLSCGIITKKEYDHIQQVRERGNNLGVAAAVLDVPPEFLDSTTTDVSPEHSPARTTATSVTSDGSDRTVFDDDTILQSPLSEFSGAETPERIATPTKSDSSAPLITLQDDGKFTFGDGVTHRPKVLTNRQKIFEVFETTSIESRFSDLESIGKGATATIYKATRVDKGDVVALKRFKTTVVPLSSRSSRLVSNEDDLADVLTEASVLQRCSHDNILTMCAAVAEPLSESDGVALWIALEYCFGSCYELLKTLKRPLTETEILALSCQVLSGLEYLHFKQIMHRDIKCGNVLISADRATAVLADFGVSKDMTTVPDGRCGTFVGSPYWIAPEVVLAMEDGQYSYPADVWSFGITVIEMAQKEPPLFHLQAMSALYNIPENDSPTLPADKNFSIAAHDFVDRCLFKDPDMRLTPPALLRHPVLKTLRARGNGTSIVEDMLVEALDARQALDTSRSAVARQRGAELVAQGDSTDHGQVPSTGATCVSPPPGPSDLSSPREKREKNPKGKPKGFFARHWRKKKRDRSSTVSDGSGQPPAHTPDVDENELLSAALKANAASFVRRSNTMDVKTNPVYAAERETVAQEMRRLREKSMKKPRGRGRKSTAI